MNLAYWQNPRRPSMERVYVNKIDAFKDKRKVWCERVGRSKSWQLNSNEDFDDSEMMSIRNMVIAHLQGLGIDKSEAVLFQVLTQVAKDESSAEAKQSNQKTEAYTQKSESIPDLDTIKIPEEISVKIDHREPPELFKLLSNLDNVNVTRSSLPIGDIQINDDIIIERKRCTTDAGEGGTDFENSIINPDKRLFNQSEKLKFEIDKICIVLLEGDAYGKSERMLVQQIDGAISFLCTIQKLSVLTTYNLKHTAYMICKLGTHHRSGLGYELGLRKKKPAELLNQKRYVLEGLPGVSSEIAKRLIEKFGSLKGVISASKKDLLSVEGLGPKKVDALLKVMDE